MNRMTAWSCAFGVSFCALGAGCSAERAAAAPSLAFAPRLAEVDSGACAVSGATNIVAPTVRRMDSGDPSAATSATGHRPGHIEGARTQLGDPPFVVGEADGKIGWTERLGDRAVPLWTLPGSDPIDSLRGVSLGATDGYAVAFRQGPSIYLGLLRADHNADGGLYRVAGTPDSRATAPSLNRVGEGRFLVTWNEGPVDSHTLRAQTFSGDGRPVGGPLAISDEEAFGGARVVVADDGRGVVSFVASSDDGFRMMATPIVCPTRPPAIESRSVALAHALR